jgi:hypothetical protein
MTPLITVAPATRTVRVIRSPPGSQLERNRAFLRMISASFMQVSDAHPHRRNRRRSASVTRSSATPPRRASSSSSSDTADAGAVADGDYELEERSAGNTPRRRSATCSRAICCPLCAAARHRDTPTIGGHPGDGPPICRKSGVHPHPHPRFARIGGPGAPTPGSNRGFRALGRAVSHRSIRGQLGSSPSIPAEAAQGPKCLQVATLMAPDLFLGPSNIPGPTSCWRVARPCPCPSPSPGWRALFYWRGGHLAHPPSQGHASPVHRQVRPGSR